MLSRGVNEVKRVRHDITKKIVGGMDVSSLKQMAWIFSENEEAEKQMKMKLLAIKELIELDRLMESKYLPEEKANLEIEKVNTLKQTGIANIDKLYDSVEEIIVKKILVDNEKCVDELVRQMKKKNTIKFTSSDGSGAGGHAFVLHRDKQGEYYIISSTQTSDNMKEEVWYEYLRKRVGKPVNIITKNKQNSNQGCIFCASYTEALLKAGYSVENLPDQMPKDIEKAMMDTVYLSMRPVYDTDDMIDTNDKAIQQGFFIHESVITESALLDNIKQNANNGEELIKNFKTLLNPKVPSNLLVNNQSQNNVRPAIVNQPQNQPIINKNNKFILAVEDMLKRSNIEQGRITTIIENAKIITFQENDIPGKTTINLEEQTFQRAGQSLHQYEEGVEDDEALWHIAAIEGGSDSITNLEIVKERYTGVKNTQSSQQLVPNNTNASIQTPATSMSDTNARRDIRYEYEAMERLYHINYNPQSTIRIESNVPWQHKQIVNKTSLMLAEAIQKTQKIVDQTSLELLQDDKFVKYVITFAQTNGGVGNAGLDRWRESLKTDFPKSYMGDDEAEKHFDVAKKLSSQYQKVAKKSGFFTGRVENLKSPLVGQRLSRIPEDNNMLDDIVKNAMQQKNQNTSRT